MLDPADDDDQKRKLLVNHEDPSERASRPGCLWQVLGGADLDDTAGRLGAERKQVRQT